MAVNRETVNNWLMEFVNYKREEAKRIEKQHGPGWISDAKFAVADEAERFVKENGGVVTNVVSSKYICGPQSDNVNIPYTESVYDDGTIIRTIKTTKKELEKLKQKKG